MTVKRRRGGLRLTKTQKRIIAGTAAVAATVGGLYALYRKRKSLKAVMKPRVQKLTPEQRETFVKESHKRKLPGKTADEVVERADEAVREARRAAATRRRRQAKRGRTTKRAKRKRSSSGIGYVGGAVGVIVLGVLAAYAVARGEVKGKSTKVQKGKEVKNEEGNKIGDSLTTLSTLSDIPHEIGKQWLRLHPKVEMTIKKGYDGSIQNSSATRGDGYCSIWAVTNAYTNLFPEGLEQRGFKTLKNVIEEITKRLEVIEGQCNPTYTDNNGNCYARELINVTLLDLHSNAGTINGEQHLYSLSTLLRVNIQICDKSESNDIRINTIPPHGNYQHTLYISTDGGHYNFHAQSQKGLQDTSAFLNNQWFTQQWEEYGGLDEGDEITGFQYVNNV